MCNLGAITGNRETRRFPRTICNGCREFIDPNIVITAELVSRHVLVSVRHKNSDVFKSYDSHIWSPINTGKKVKICKCDFGAWYLLEFCEDNEDNTFPRARIKQDI